MKLSNHIHFEKQSIKFIWISLTFAIGYWIIESLRDVYVFDKGSLLKAIFYPDINLFWIRMMVVLIIVLFGSYIQSLRLVSYNKAPSKMNKVKQIHIIIIGIFFSIIYWLLEAFRDIFVYNEQSFFDQVFELSTIQFWMRFLPVCMLMLFSGYAQSIFNHHYKIEDQLRESNKKLTELDQLKSDFLNTVSHELRTPIAIMKEGVSLCMDDRVGNLNKIQTKLLTDTITNIERLNRLVTDLLDLSKIEVGKLKLNRRIFDIIPILENVCTSYMNQARKNQINLTWNSNVSSILIYADEDKIIQILNNLLNNAFRFTMTGGTISIYVKDLENSVQFQVCDTGVGISEKDQTRLFTKFEQIERVNVSGYKGTGLGLSICKGLVEKQGGKISVKSKLGKGTNFYFTIKKVAFPKILIVDDEKEIIQVIQSTLEKEHFHTVAATDGMSALRLAIDVRPSLILLDMHLGRMSGYELIGRLKQDKRTAYIPLVIVSGFKVNEKRLPPSIQHEIPVVRKPFNIHELKHTVRQNLAA